MNNSFHRLIDGMVNTLRKEVIPRIEDDFARGQTYGVIYVLNQLKARGSWSVEFLGQQVAAQRTLFDEVAAIASGLPLPIGPDLPVVEPISADELEQLREQGNRRISALLDWLESRQGDIGPDTRTALEAAIRRCLRKDIEIEMANTAQSMFSEISLGTEAEDGAPKSVARPRSMAR